MLPDEIVFSMDDEPYRWRDVILAAVRRGDWQAVERQARLGAACVRHAADTDDPVPAATLDAAASEFRYARDLITAQSMETWLERWSLSVADWTAYLQRDLLRGRYAGQLDTLAARYPPDDDEAARLALIDAICSGALDRWARTLAARAAVHAGMASATPSTVGNSELADDSTRHSPPGFLFGANRTLLKESADRLDAIEESFDRFSATQLTDRALSDCISQRQLDWIRFDCRMMSFPDEGMAAEAAMLMREDGERFTGVYRVAHVEPREVRVFLDEIDDRIRDRFFGVRAGDLVGPLRLNGEYVVYEIREKLLPKVADPEVRRRAEETVLRLALDHQLDRRVRWHDTPTR